MIDPSRTCFFIPPELKSFKRNLFLRIGAHIASKGGRVQDGHMEPLRSLPRDVLPIVGCTIALREMIQEWQRTGRDFIYWDRGYARRVFATHLGRGTDGGYYRWHINSFQMRSSFDAPSDRWDSLQKCPPEADIEVKPWQRDGKHIVIAAPTRTYAKFHGCESWIGDTIDALARATKRQLVIRDKESKRTLQEDIERAHALVSHGSIAAVESVVLGCPVFVDRSSAAAIVGKTELREIEEPAYPDRKRWLSSLAYCQFTEKELVDGTLWRLLRR